MIYLLRSVNDGSLGKVLDDSHIDLLGLTMNRYETYEKMEWT